MNWIEFFNDNQIEWVSRGPNTARGHVSIRCPWCAEEDPSQHLGISLGGKGWGCLRNGSHRGSSASRLISGLLGISLAEAKVIEAQYGKTDPNAFINMDENKGPKALVSEITPDFRSIKTSGSTVKYYNYLHKRGFSEPEKVIEQYRLKCCLTGRFKDRLIIPFYQGGELVAWTGRAIAPTLKAARYLSSKLVKTTVFNEDHLTGGDTLFIVEGPFDALKLDFYGQQHGARATCVFGTVMSMDQVTILSVLAKRFRRTVILFDADAVEQSWEAAHWLNCQIGSLPDGVKDPGELDERQLREIQGLARMA